MRALARESWASNQSYKVGSAVSVAGVPFSLLHVSEFFLFFLILSQKNPTVFLSEDWTLRTVAVSEMNEARR